MIPNSSGTRAIPGWQPLSSRMLVSLPGDWLAIWDHSGVIWEHVLGLLTGAGACGVETRGGGIGQSTAR